MLPHLLRHWRVLCLCEPQGASNYVSMQQRGSSVFVQVITTLDGEMGFVFIIAEGGRLNWIL